MLLKHDDYLAAVIIKAQYTKHVSNSYSRQHDTTSEKY